MCKFLWRELPERSGEERADVCLSVGLSWLPGVLGGPKVAVVTAGMGTDGLEGTRTRTKARARARMRRRRAQKGRRVERIRRQEWGYRCAASVRVLFGGTISTAFCTHSIFGMRCYGVLLRLSGVMEAQRASGKKKPKPERARVAPNQESQRSSSASTNTLYSSKPRGRASWTKPVAHRVVLSAIQNTIAASSPRESFSHSSVFLALHLPASPVCVSSLGVLHSQTR